MNKFFLFLLLFSVSTMTAQQSFKVRRCAAIDRRAPVKNIFVDENNNKWVGDEKGLFLAQSPEHAGIVDVESHLWSLLSVPDGNYELEIPKEDLSAKMGDSFNEISTAFFDKKLNELWIGTTESGVFRFFAGIPSGKTGILLNKTDSLLRGNDK